MLHDPDINDSKEEKESSDIELGMEAIDDTKEDLGIDVNVDETEIATIDDGGIDLASGLEFSVNGTAIGGSATALIDGDSDFTLTDCVASGIHYELDDTDMANWNAGGVALTTAGGIFTHHQTQAATYTVAANTGSVLAGPITITGTVTNNGTMVVV